MSSNRKKGRYGGYNINNEFNLLDLSPMNSLQKRALNSSKNIVLSGYAGTGKTFLASYIGLRDIFDKKYNKLTYIRSAVATRNIGFLPGTDKEKLEVYEMPYIDIVSDLLKRGDAYSILKLKGLITFTSTSFIRGNNLDNAVVVVDEIQNMTSHELDSIITRLRENCKIIFCGDFRQADLAQNGMEEFLKVLRDMGSFDFIEFDSHEHIVRSELVKEYIISKEKVLNKL